MAYKWKGDALKRALVNDLKNWVSGRNLREVDGVKHELIVEYEGNLSIALTVLTDGKPPRYFEFTLAERY